MGSGNSSIPCLKPSFGQERREGSLGDGPKTQQRICGVNSVSHQIWELFQIGISQNPAGIHGKILGHMDQSHHAHVLFAGFKEENESPSFSRGKLDVESNAGKFWIYKLLFNWSLIVALQDFSPLQFHGKMSWFNFCKGKTKLALSQTKISLLLWFIASKFRGIGILLEIYSVDQ